VFVNRVWHHLHGAGLVPSVDNFGMLGDMPTQQPLLDALSAEFAATGWDMKGLIRKLALSRTYRLDSRTEGNALALDALNSAWHHIPAKRLEGEAIRDAMLCVSGSLDAAMFGPSIPVHLTAFHDGRGKPGVSGPLNGANRRSLYLAVRRNFMNPWMLAFDTPTPFSTVGRRQVSNVPAISLTLLNDPFVQEQATLTAKKLLATPGTTEARLKRLDLAALGRTPTAAEIATVAEYLAATPDDATKWADVVHSVFNLKEFIDLR